MDFTAKLTQTEILDVFNEELHAVGGEVHDMHMPDKLVARSILPHLAKMRPGDEVSGGVALRATDKTICVAPYLHRQICSNGLIAAQTIQARNIQNDDRVMTELQLREAVQACCSREAFNVTSRQLRTTQQLEIDLDLMLMRMVARLPESRLRELRLHIAIGFDVENDRTRYGFINAVTAVARDTDEPELQWYLQEFAGSMLTTRKLEPYQVQGHAVGQ